MPSRADSLPNRDLLALVNTADEAALLAAVERHLARGEAFCVATLNLDHLVKLGRDRAFREAYLRHTHVVADGNPVVWLRRVMGRPVRLVPGANLIAPLAALAARTQAPVALLGSTRETLDLAAGRLGARHPGLKIVAKIAPGRNFDPTGPEADAALAEVARSGARLCLVALGAPRQEILAARAAATVPGCGFVSIGAGLDFIAGTQRRAPRWVQRIALEWLWRLATNPVRLARRYGACLAILPGLFVSAWRARAAR